MRFASLGNQFHLQTHFERDIDQAGYLLALVFGPFPVSDAISEVAKQVFQVRGFWLMLLLFLHRVAYMSVREVKQGIYRISIANFPSCIYVRRWHMTRVGCLDESVESNDIA